MDFKKFESKLEANRQKPLPGPGAQYKMTPAGRPRKMPEFDDNNPPKRAAVSALFHNKEGQAHLVLIKRNAYPGVHGGQIAFPGGGVEQQDADLMQTALRETREEVGVEPGHLHLYRQLSPLYIPPSHYWVQPYIFYTDATLAFTPQQSEVAGIIELPLLSFFDSGNCKNVALNVRGNPMNVPAFCIGSHIIWGATAMMISEIIELLKE